MISLQLNHWNESSIRKFPKKSKFADLIGKSAPFKQVEWQELNFGIVCIHSGWKL